MMNGFKYLFGMTISSGILFSVSAGACNVAPFSETWNLRGTTEWIQNGNDCVLEASVEAGAPAAATVHYRRAKRSAELRLSFVLAPPSTLISIANTHNATLATGVARSVPADGPPQAALFGVNLMGDPSSAQPQLRFEAACALPAGFNGLCSAHAPITLADFPLRITLELRMGVANAGQLSAWLGDDTSGTPDILLENLDNSLWQGIDRVSLGLSSVSASMASMIAAQPFSFSEITVNEPQLFWSDFESEFEGNIAVTGAPVGGNTIVSGNTCLGTTQFPYIASGSTRLDGMTTVHPIELDSSLLQELDLVPTVPGTRMFVCPAGSGPSGPCIDASAELFPVYLWNQPAGSYHVVVGNVELNCGGYKIVSTAVPN